MTIASFQDYVQASIAKSKLDSAGIDCWMADDIFITLQWSLSRALGGVKLRVREHDAQEARLVLEETVVNRRFPKRLPCRCADTVLLADGPSP